MKLALRMICGLALALTLVGLVTHLSAADLSGAAQLARENLASGLVNIGGKLAIIGGLICAFLGVQRAQWGWVATLAVAVAFTLFCGALAILTNTGIAFYIIGPVAAASLAIVYTVRTRSLTPVRVR